MGGHGNPMEACPLRVAPPPPPPVCTFHSFSPFACSVHNEHRKMGLKAGELGVLATENPLNPKANREKTIQIIFEEIEACQFFWLITAQASLMATGS